MTDHLHAITFTVPGEAQPAGSKRAFVRGGHAQIVDANPKAKDWKGRVADFARRAYSGPVFDEPLRLDVTFVRVRPRGHYGSGRNAGVLKASAPQYPTTKPDTTKLLRALEDGCNAVLWRDDAAIVEQSARKVFGDSAEVRVTVTRLNGG